MIRSNQAGQAKNRPPRREEGENGNLQRFPDDGRGGSYVRYRGSEGRHQLAVQLPRGAPRVRHAAV
ncbi:hypothetical protein [Profundibacter sp.]|uniref:hypothetical protein n=1 Tax=Profundibacter sp. TaxID=3101071 RepID=UPI003D0BEC64